MIAHRGASGRFPENTLSAFWGAINAKTDIIELDLQLTSDEEVVVFHDKTVDRIFQIDSGKSINDYSLEEVKKIDAGSWFNPEFSNVRIPTLDEVLESLPRESSLILEIKGDKEKLVSSTITSLENMNKTLGSGYISVKDIETLNAVNECTDKCRTGLMQKGRTALETIKMIEENEISIIQIRWRNWNEEEWQILSDLNKIVTVFYSDREDEFEYLLEKKVDGILTNYPSHLVDFLDKKI